jgi:thiol-disulfide isomerase/thioredoxin
VIRSAVLALLAALVAGSSGASAAPTPTLAPVLAATSWLNGRAAEGELRGKVVLVDVFAVDCYNCKNVTPNLRKLSETERGKVAIVGVHTPETRFERDRSHVVSSLRELGITWPVALDNDSAIWTAYGVEYWPTQLIFDRKGHLRKTVIGDSQDDVVNDAIRKLLAET